jgi:putative Holliday junction resolvase
MIAKDLQEFYQSLKPRLPIISIDYGEKKVGIAVSNPEWTIAMPIDTIYEQDQSTKIKKALEVVGKYSACAIVLGMPFNMDGTSSLQTQIVQKFATSMEEKTDLPIFLQDERLTSRAADSFLKSFGQSRKTRNNNDDSVAASMILESTLSGLRKLN